MAANPASLQLTDRYARELKRTAARVEQIATSRWNLAPEDFDGSYSSWLDVVVPVVTQAQQANQRLTQGYLTAFITSETGRRPRLPQVESVVGKSRDGRDLREAWSSPLIKAKVAVRDGKTPVEASGIAQAAAVALVGVDTYHAGRGPLTALMDAVKGIVGYRRVTVGATCGACMGAADGSVVSKSAEFHIHAGCDCVSEPVIGNLPDTAQRKTGQQIFNELSPAEQNARVGEEAANALRSGEIRLPDLIGFSPMKTEPDWLTQKPLNEVL